MPLRLFPIFLVSLLALCSLLLPPMLPTPRMALAHEETLRVSMLSPVCNKNIGLKVSQVSEKYRNFLYKLYNTKHMVWSGLTWYGQVRWVQVWSGEVWSGKVKKPLAGDTSLVKGFFYFQLQG